MFPENAPTPNSNHFPDGTEDFPQVLIKLSLECEL